MIRIGLVHLPIFGWKSKSRFSAEDAEESGQRNPETSLFPKCWDVEGVGTFEQAEVSRGGCANRSMSAMRN